MYIQKLEQIKHSPRTPEQLKKHNILHNQTRTKKNTDQKPISNLMNTAHLINLHHQLSNPAME